MIDINKVKVGDKVQVIKGKGILAYKIYGGHIYTVRQIGPPDKVFIKGFWVHVDRLKWPEGEGGVLMDFSTPTPAQHQGVVEKFPCKCDPNSFEYMSNGCGCGAIPKYRPSSFIR